jgi:hypothetical protein
MSPAGKPDHTKQMHCIENASVALPFSDDHDRSKIVGSTAHKRLGGRKDKGRYRQSVGREAWRSG